MKGEIMVFERQVFSLALIEKELHRLYSLLFKKVDDLAVKTLFSYISTDSLKHSKILATIFEEVNDSKIREKHCAQNIIHTKKLIKKLVSELNKFETISLEKLKTLIETLVSFENNAKSPEDRAYFLSGVNNHHCKPAKRDRRSALFYGRSPEIEKARSAIV